MLPAMRYETKKLTELYHKRKYLLDHTQILPRPSGLSRQN